MQGRHDLLGTYLIILHANKGNILDHGCLYNPHDILHRVERNRHGIPYHLPVRNLFRGPESCQEDWCVWAQPNKKT